jgi:flagellar basal-body rod protein FlgG
MPIGIYAAAAGMAAQQTRIDSLANDIANLNTTGYKSQRLAFHDLVYSLEQGVEVGGGASTIDLGRSLEQGAVRQTGDPLNVAIEGPGYFRVRREDGTPALTRDGSFRLDASGELVISTGERLDPPVRVPRGTDPSRITISSGGAVSVAGKSVGKLTVVDVPAPSNLTSLGGNLFAASAASGAPIATDVKVEQGSLEASNVDLARTFAGMIEAQRGYELTSRAIKTQDELLDVANQLVR